MLKKRFLALSLSLAALGLFAGVASLDGPDDPNGPDGRGGPAATARTVAARASSGCQAAAPPVTPGRTAARTLTSGGQQRSYLVHVPAGYRTDRSTAAVLAFHGSGQSNTLMESYSNLDSLDAIVLYPQGTTGTNGSASWEGAPYASGADDVGFVKDLLDRTESQFCVDKNRVYATGKSNGGGFTALLACQLPQRIAAFAPVAGAYYPQSARGCGTGPAVSMLEFHGTGDSVIDYDGGTSHGVAYPAVPEWLDSRVRKDQCRKETRRTVGTDVAAYDWTDCAGGTEVAHYQVTDGGHTWPGAVARSSGPGYTTRTVSATAVMWDFFQRHPLGG
ncbi:PHB depolymerase family esterase [Streptomyces sp. WAC06614]|uniref:alpha/beta hydrolase family esterase n=1 Tax=Streptomyces sp. WAC06614 TaxID=2487416 RepID=UPI00163C31EB|nr:PHB depolymerase family esterase [Streptomyces sp. WAC06614]